MKAMILAAGFGIRLKPYTNYKPKALIEVHGISLLELLIRKLICSGINDIIINVHHLKEMIIEFLKEKSNFNINIKLSIEDDILGTGGGIKKVAYFFDDGIPFLVHNVDIFTNVNLNELYKHHLDYHNLATLAVMERTTDRGFIIDPNNLICGHFDKKKNTERIVKKPRSSVHAVAFSGIHVISPKIFSLITEQGFFSIIDVYLRLIAEGYRIGVYQMDNYYWNDIGTIEKLKNIESDIKNNITTLFPKRQRNVILKKVEK